MKKIAFFIIYLLVTITHFLVTFVVILSVLGTLSILNQNVFHLENPDYIEKAFAAAIFLISVFVFFKSLDKISRRIKTVFFKDR